MIKEVLSSTQPLVGQDLELQWNPSWSTKTPGPSFLSRRPVGVCSMPVVGHWPAPGIPTGSLLGEDGGFVYLPPGGV